MLRGFFMKSVRVSLPPGSKLANIVGGLNEPVEYVRNVLGALNKHGGRRNPDVLVTLSLQGSVTAPDYQIIEIMDAETRESTAIAAYSGRTHKELPWNDKTALIYWSEENSSFIEIQNLIGALRTAAKHQRQRRAS
jgi:hypothetical protein